MSLSIVYNYKSNQINITNWCLENCLVDTTLIITKEDKAKIVKDSNESIIIIKYKNKKKTYKGEVKLDISDFLGKYTKNPSNICIAYGADGFYRDITDIALNKCVKNGILFIPAEDSNRDILFGDPIYGTVKHIKILYSNKCKIYSEKENILLDVTNTQKLKESPYTKLAKIHFNLAFLHGSLRDEYPEQIMLSMFLQPENIVLEFGSNIGRATVVAASLLEKSENLVTLECDSISYKKLLHNRDINELKFSVENAALSYKPLLLSANDCIGFTVEGNETVPGYEKINTITFEELEAKHSLKFDTFVIDCEGAFYYIVKENPHILKNINLIIMENDYKIIEHKKELDDILRNAGLVRVYVEGCKWKPCAENFYEVWKRGT